jgi:hypothetical protein
MMLSPSPKGRAGLALLFPAIARAQHPAAPATVELRAPVVSVTFW